MNRPTIHCTLHLDSGTYRASFDYLPAEPDAGIRGDGWECCSLTDVTGAEIEFAELAVREDSSERWLVSMFTDAALEQSFGAPDFDASFCTADEALFVGALTEADLERFAAAEAPAYAVAS